LVAGGTAPSARYGHTALLHNDCMWVFGGVDGKNTAFNDFHFFDFKTNQWGNVGKSGDVVWPPPRYDHSSVIIQNHMWVFGGAVTNKKYLNDMYCFDFDSKQWKSIEASSNTPGPRAGHLTFATAEGEDKDKKLWIFGGFSGDGGFTYHKDTHSFDLVSHNWSEEEVTGSLPPTGRPLVGAMDHRKGVIYVYGGYDGQYAVGTFLEFELKSKKWSVAQLWLELGEGSGGTVMSAAVVGSQGMTPTPRYGHVMVLNVEEELISVFGGSGSTYLNDLIQFDVNPEE